MAKTAGEETSRTKLFELLIKNPGEVVSSSRVTELLSASRQPFSRLHVRCATRGCRSNRCRRRATASAIWRRCRRFAHRGRIFHARQSAFQKFLYFKEADSTQSVIKSLARAGGSGGIVACAETQNAGRGRRGRSWAGTPGKNLTFSALLRPKLKPGEVQLLNLAAGLAVKETLRAMYGIPAELKWPNDILCRGRKCAASSAKPRESRTEYITPPPASA